MMRAGLAPPRLPPGPAPAPLLDRAGACVVLGDQLDGDGLPKPLAPDRTSLFAPRGVAFAGREKPFFVADTGHHRLLVWRRPPEQNNAPADIVIGQPGFGAEGRNARGPAGAATLDMPTGVATDGKVLAVADAWNHRVLVWRSLPSVNNQPADIVLGQADFCGALANRGLDVAASDTLNWCYGVTIADGRLFVADTGNRRVLIWNRLPQENGRAADMVLGQSSMTCRDDNAGEGASDVGMRWPHAVAVAGGRIFVADAGNNRIMVWRHFPNADGAPASYVIGQESFATIDHNRGALHPNARALQMPYGVSAHDDMLVCADTANSRLVGFPLDGLAMNAAATALAGQRRFEDKGDNRWRAAARDSLCWPFAVAACEGLVAVADTGNNRVLLWETAR